MAKKYSEYINIDESYCPIVDPDSINAGMVDWKGTYPHETFVDALKRLEGALARRGKKHAIWIEGAYGTGKSRIMWTLANILSCPQDDLIDYFGRYDELKRETELRDRLIGHKSGDILVVSRYDAGQTRSIDALVKEVYNSVAKELKAKGYDGSQGSLRESIAKWLEKESHADIFKRLMNEPDLQSLPTAQKDIAEIISILRSSDECKGMIAELFRIAEEGNVTIFDLSIDNLKEWLKGVIEKNNLKAIVFFYDEFGPFISLNRHSLSSFQSLVELQSSTNFYMVIATHESRATEKSLNGEYSKSDESPLSKVSGRFQNVRIQMPNDVALRLIKNAIKIKKGHESDFEEDTLELNDRMVRSRKKVSEITRVDEETLRGICPIHPVSALMLKYIANKFAANQRSMFSFISDESEDLEAFRWFINEKSIGAILTVDYLWNFFYEHGTDEYSNRTGRDNFDSTIVSILDVFPRNKDKLETPEQERVLKAVLLMEAVSSYIDESIDLLVPLEENIKLAFEGDDVLANKIAVVLKSLVEKRILSSEEKGSKRERLYQARRQTFDEEEFEETRKRIRSNVKTDELLKKAEITVEKFFSQHDELQLRFKTRIATVNDFRQRIHELRETKLPFIPLLVCFAHCEDERELLFTMIDETTKKEEYKSILIVDATERVLTNQELDDYALFSANELLRQKHGTKRYQSCQNDLKRLLTQWKNGIWESRFVIISTDRESIECSNLSSLYQEIGNLVKRRYPLSFDDIEGTTYRYFSDSVCRDWLKKGAIRAVINDKEEKVLKCIFGETRHEPRYWEKHPQHKISIIKKKLDSFINAKLQQENDPKVDFKEIFEFLMLEYGFLPCNLYAYLTGFLLSEYASGEFRYSVADGKTGGRLDVEVLGDKMGVCIIGISRNKKDVESTYLAKLTEGQIQFLNFARKCFDYDESDDFTIETCATRLRNFFSDNVHCPVWSFKYLVEKKVRDAVSIFGSLLKFQNGDSVPALADQFGLLYASLNKTEKKTLEELFSFDNGNKAIQRVIETINEGDFLALALSLFPDTYMKDVRDKIVQGQGNWLWDEETGKQQIEALRIEYEIISVSNAILGRSSSFGDCWSKWREFAERLKAPRDVYVRYHHDLEGFFDLLVVIVKNSSFSDVNDYEVFLTILQNHSDQIKRLIDNSHEVLRSEFPSITNGLNDNDIKSLRKDLPLSSFTDGESSYVANLVMLANARRANNERTKLCGIWRDLSDSDSPRDWSNRHSTPILALVGKFEQEGARRLFEVLNNCDSRIEDIRWAQEYLEKNPCFIKALREDKKIQKAFQDKILYPYESILSDLDYVRTYLRDQGYACVDEWFDSAGVRDLIRKLANESYKMGKYRDVQRDIESMSADEMKVVLLELAKNVQIGIEIIQRKKHQ